MGWGASTCDQVWSKSIMACQSYKSLKCWQKKKKKEEEEERNRTKTRPCRLRQGNLSAGSYADSKATASNCLSPIRLMIQCSLNIQFCTPLFKIYLLHLHIHIENLYSAFPSRLRLKKENIKRNAKTQWNQYLGYRCDFNIFLNECNEKASRMVLGRAFHRWGALT